MEFNGVVIGKEKVDFLLDSDIFVFPSYYLFEGHPLVIIEAMAAGCPVISTNIASIPETVIHGENGFLVEPKASGKMAENIEILIKNGELRKKMGLRSRQIYEEKYTLETNIKNMIGIFNNVLKKKD